MDRVRAGGVLAGLGLLLAIVSIRFGDPTSEFGLGWPGFLLGAGVALGVLGVATVVRPPTAARDAVAVSIVSLAVVFAVGTAIIYSDLVASNPGDWIPPNLSRVVAIQAAVMAHAVTALGVGLVPRRLMRRVTGTELPG